MPLYSSDCQAPSAVCQTMFAVAEHLLQECYVALLACFELTISDPIVAYVTVGNGDDGIVDALTVNVGPLTPNTGKAGQPTVWRTRYVVRLRESGWPMVRVEGEQIVMPPPDEQKIASRALYSHGEALLRKLTHMNRERALAPKGIGVVSTELGPLVPLAPSGGVAGWEATVVVDMAG